ncbi:MAG: hypothetical protein H7329_18630 [Opitutaceae bacterium]|nr:hypothetical protein [Cytophagales bacterium]
MKSPFFLLWFLKSGIFLFFIFTNLDLHAQAPSNQPVVSDPLKKEGEIAATTYSKVGSDSISYIIFGRLLSQGTNTANNKAGKPSNFTPEQEKSKKRDKFNIKSTDKLKSNNSLY